MQIMQIMNGLLNDKRGGFSCGWWRHEEVLKTKREGEE